MDRELDIIIFGATGFTGKYTVLNAVKLLSTYKWGIAGRNLTKLEAVLKEMGSRTGTDLSEKPIIIAEINDDQSLEQMAKRAKVIVNCCGPYQLYGEPVIKACIKSSTNHVDVSGEPQFMEKMQLEYNELAAENNCYVISGCGFDSIPADLGTVFFEKTFNGRVNAIEIFVWSDYVGPVESKSRAVMHYGTWASAVHSLAHIKELKGLRSKLFKDKVPIVGPLLRYRVPHFKQEIGGTIEDAICVPFPGPDKSVVMRSQRLMYENEKKPLIQMQTYYNMKSILNTFIMVILSAIFCFLSRFSIGQRLLLTFPKIFSFGAASHEGPAEPTMNNTKFSMLFLGNGWKEKSKDPSECPNGEPLKTLITKVSGMNPGYGSTCVALLLSATTILTESSLIPGKGGVLPPGYAFAKTRLIDELCANGITFEVIESNDESVAKSKKIS